jgi:hypothetical protein
MIFITGNYNRWFILNFYKNIKPEELNGLIVEQLKRVEISFFYHKVIPFSFYPPPASRQAGQVLPTSREGRFGTSFFACRNKPPSLLAGRGDGGWVKIKFKSLIRLIKID